MHAMQKRVTFAAAAATRTALMSLSVIAHQLRVRSFYTQLEHSRIPRGRGTLMHVLPSNAA
jgi:hypothetical protein